jgi:acetolactate synthase-1/2/3 large subunit
METAAEVFVRCLENEGVRHVFGIPGEETLDLNEALDHCSSIQFIPVRHEQGGAFMADAYGRLTGHAGVCLGTLGPGATNLVTGIADAFLDRAPVVALTGQTDLSEMHKESHQYIDVVRMMKPVTKWNARVHDPDIIPEAVRKAFAVAEREKPGATHLELPADVMELPHWWSRSRPSCTAPPSCCRRRSGRWCWRGTASLARTPHPRCGASCSRPGWA